MEEWFVRNENSKLIPDLFILFFTPKLNRIIDTISFGESTQLTVKYFQV
jgi:hypothetical protein